MNYQKIDRFSIADGIGIRVVLWVSGCNRQCKGCHNQKSWDFESGKILDDVAKAELFDALSKPYIRGITFSGGHPLEDRNLPIIHDLIKDVRAIYPDKDIWLYTGYTFDGDLLHIKNLGETGLLRTLIISMCDVIIDGEYIEEQRDITLPFKGSRNQRIIDVKETHKQGKIIELNIE